MCKHEDDTILWALDFVLLKGEAPPLFNTKDKYTFIEALWVILPRVSFFLPHISPAEKAGLTLLLSHYSFQGQVLAL